MNPIEQGAQSAQNPELDPATAAQIQAALYHGKQTLQQVEKLIHQVCAQMAIIDDESDPKREIGLCLALLREVVTRATSAKTSANKVVALIGDIDAETVKRPSSTQPQALHNLEPDNLAGADRRAVTIPARAQHEGIYAVTVTLEWRCPQCGGPRGEIFNTRSYDGGLMLNCDGWHNRCGHVDKYDEVRKEAARNGLNAPNPAAKPKPRKPNQKQLELINQAGATLAFFSSALAMVRFSPNVARVDVLLTNLERIKVTLQALRIETADRDGGVMSNRNPVTAQPLELAQQTKAHFKAILDKIEETLTTYHNGENVSLELALHDVSRLACDGHAVALELHSRLNWEGV